MPRPVALACPGHAPATGWGAGTLLSAFFIPEDLWRIERTYLAFCTYFHAEEAFKQWAIQCLIVPNDRYQSFFGTHTLEHKIALKLLCNKIFFAAGPLLTYKLGGQKPPQSPLLAPQLQFFTVFCPPSIWSLFSFCCS